RGAGEPECGANEPSRQRARKAYFPNDRVRGRVVREHIAERNWHGAEPQRREQCSHAERNERERNGKRSAHGARSIAAASASAASIAYQAPPHAMAAGGSETVRAW